MFKIVDSNKIYLTKGDTAYLTIELENDEIFYVGDVVNFSVKRKLNNDPDYVIQKRIEIEDENNSLVIKIQPEDTQNMSYGFYYYDVQLTRKNGDVFTIITPDIDNPETNFKLLKEVTLNE